MNEVSDAVATPVRTATAVLYLRVSTKDQANRHGNPEGYSLPTQRAECQRKAESLGAQVVAEFIDKDTGTTTEDRPALKELLRKLQSGELRADYVIVFKLERWARNARDDRNTDFILEMLGTSLVSCTENIDRSAAGRFVHTILASVNEYQSRNMSDDIKRKTLAKVKAGGTPFLAPIGYLNKQDGIDVRYVVVDPDRAEHITWAFDAYATGEWTLVALAEALDARGLRTRGGRKRRPAPLTISNLQTMLRNPYYKRVVRFNGVEYAGVHQPLTTAETWQRVQDVLDSKRNGEKSRAHPHYLKGTIFCGHCGSRLCVTYARGSKGVVYPYYVCLGRHQRRTACTLQARAIAVVEALIEAHYDVVQCAKGVIEELRPILRDAVAEQRDEVESIRRRQTKRIQQLEQERRKLLELHYQDALPVELFKDEQQRITNELWAAEVAVKRASLDLDRIDTTVSQALAWATNCQRAYIAGNPQVRRQMNQAFFKAIWITEEGIVRWEFAEPWASLLGFAADPVIDLKEAVEREQHRRAWTSASRSHLCRGLKETTLVDQIRTGQPGRVSRLISLVREPARISRVRTSVAAILDERRQISAALRLQR